MTKINPEVLINVLKEIESDLPIDPKSALTRIRQVISFLKKHLDNLNTKEDYE